MIIPEYRNLHQMKRRAETEVRRQLEEARLLDQISARSCTDQILSAQITQMSMIQSPSAFITVRLDVFRAEKNYRERLKKKKHEHNI